MRAPPPAALALLAAGLLPASAPADGRWPRSTPEAGGLDRGRLERATRFAREALEGVQALLVVRRGRLVWEWRRAAPETALHPLHSVTKSVTSALVGVALGRGELRSVDTPVGRLLPQLAGAAWADATVADLLTMRAGFDWDEEGAVFRRWRDAPDRIAFAAARGRVRPPGAVFEYSSAVSHALAAILERAVGTDLAAYAREHLFEPVGIDSFRWERDPGGRAIGAYGLWMGLADLARLGQLYLDGGRRGERPLLRPGWVEESTRRRLRVFEAYGDHGYGYHWWVKEADGRPGYRGWGRGGQYLVVVPGPGLVVVVRSDPVPPHPTTAHFSLLFDLVADALHPPEPARVTLAPGVALPPGMEGFLRRFAEALAAPAPADLADCYAADFGHLGLDRERALALWAASAARTPVTRVDLAVTGAAAVTGDLWRLDGQLTTNLGACPFPVPPLARRNGRWQLTGDGGRLPAGVTDLLEEHARAVLVKDVAAASELYDPAYLDAGRDRAHVLELLGRRRPVLMAYETVVTRFEPDGDEARVEGWRVTDRGVFPLRTRLRRTDRWRWYGDRRLALAGGQPFLDGNNPY